MTQKLTRPALLAIYKGCECSEIRTAIGEYLTNLKFSDDTVEIGISNTHLTSLYSRGSESQIKLVESFGIKNPHESRVKNWMDLPKKQIWFINAPSEMIQGELQNKSSFYNSLPNRETAEAMLALCQLLLLRDNWIEGWVPDWSDPKTTKYNLRSVENNVEILATKTVARSMSFPTSEMAKNFRDTFKDLLIKAKTLI